MSDEEHPRLVQEAVAEEASDTTGCGEQQQDVPENVCIRDKDHDGPHVGVTDGTYLQWEV